MADNPFRIDVYHHFSAVDESILTALNDLEARIMSKIGDKINEVNASLDAAIERVQDDVEAQSIEIQRLEELVANDVATPEELDALDTLKQKLDALDPVSPTVLPPEPPPVTEPPTEPPQV